MTTGIVGSTRCAMFWRVLGRELELEPGRVGLAGADAERVEQRVLRRPRRAARLRDRADGIEIHRHACSCSSVQRHDNMVELGSALRDEVGNDLGELRRLPAHLVVARGRAAAPAFGHRDAVAVDEEHAAGHVGVVVRTEPHDERRDVGGVERVERPPRARRPHAHEVLGHARARDRRDRVRAHAVAAELEAADDRERGDAGLGRAVVGLARRCRTRPTATTCSRCGLAPACRPSPGRASTRPRDGSARTRP